MVRRDLEHNRNVFTHLFAERSSGSCGGAGSARRGDPTTPRSNPFPHAQVTKMAFAWSKDQTPSNYYYYYYYCCCCCYYYYYYYYYYH